MSRSQRDILLKVIFKDYSSTHVLRAGSPSASIEQLPDNLQVIKDYLLLGVTHILSGMDHLLFVLALLFLVGSLSSLIKTITAFTLSHSLTLGAAVLGWISVPLPPVEACIAWSILCLAVEMVRKQKGYTSLTLRKPWLAALGFGLIHGFGFAGALVETGLPATDIPSALLVFNLGVELGQLIFVVPIYALLVILAHLNWKSVVHRVTGYGIGSISVFWLINRILLFKS